jgi:hypothetical protein
MADEGDTPLALKDLLDCASQGIQTAREEYDFLEIVAFGQRCLVVQVTLQGSRVAELAEAKLEAVVVGQKIQSVAEGGLHVRALPLGRASNRDFEAKMASPTLAVLKLLCAATRYHLIGDINVSREFEEIRDQIGHSGAHPLRDVVDL